MKSEKPRVVIVSGLSGSGKTTAMAALEDVGFYCVDNLPPLLVEQFLDLCRSSSPPIHEIAFTIDAREDFFLKQFPAMLEALERRGVEVMVFFLDCSNEILMNRYRETRRVHPLAPWGSVEQGIEDERRLLSTVAKRADWVLDSSALTVHQLKETVIRKVVKRERTTVINLISFGFRYGTPESAELLFDVRFLPNPYFEPALKALSGRDSEVADYVLKGANGAAFMEHLDALLKFLIPLYEAEGKAYISIGLGCTGGRHRSVAVAEALEKHLLAAGRKVNLLHRDMEKGL